MAILVNKTVTDGRNNQYSVGISDSYYCDENEEYKTQLLYDFSGFSWPEYWGGTMSVSFTLDKIPNYNGRCALRLSDQNQFSIVQCDDLYGSASFTADVWNQRLDQHTYSSTIAWLGSAYAYSDVSGMQFACIGSCNMPIFETQADAQAYLSANTQADALNALKKAINYKDSTVEVDNDEVFINNYGVLQKWTVNGKEEVHSSSLIYRCFKMKVTAGKISFYKIEGIDGDSLKCGIKYSDDFNAISIGYSEDGGNTYTYVESLPYNFIYRTRENELGEFYACPVNYKEIDTNIHLFEDEETAQDYVDGLIDGTQALNWGVVSKYTDITNGTGTADEETEFGEVFAKNFFSQCYLCGATAIQEIANALFDTDATGITHFWEKIKEGVEMYGNDPMQSVQGLTYFPVNLTSLFTNYQSQQYVYFGGYKLDLSVAVNRLIFPDGYKTLGTFVLKKTFKNWRDYEPFCKAYIYLPYVGTYQLDLARYYDKTTEVRYYIDVRTGGCVACLIADGILTDYYNGQMGVQMPITLTDKSSYANAQIETLLGGIKHEGSVLQGAGQTGSAGGSAGMYVAVAQGTAGTMLNASMTTYKLTENNINNYNKTKGGSSSMLNEYLPQYVTLMLEIQQDDPTENHDMLLGMPTNESGTVGSFSGFLQVDSVNLQCGIATPNEKKEILSALLNGIFI